MLECSGKTLQRLWSHGHGKWKTDCCLRDVLCTNHLGAKARGLAAVPLWIKLPYTDYAKEADLESRSGLFALMWVSLGHIMEDGVQT